MTVIDDVRDRADIVEVVGGHVALRKSGRNFTGRCPFHEERTPSFVVTPDRGLWRCFGACGVGGDVFDFVMRVENVDFRGALELLARRYGVELTPPTPDAAERQARRDRYRAALDAAAAHFHQNLMRTAGGEAARQYLTRRRFDAKAATDFLLGWAPDSRTATADALRAQGFTDEDLLGSGLVRPRDSGGVFDTFHGRLMFPIRDGRGRTVGFGGRTLDPEGVPKYLNSPQGELFDKSRLLYALDRAVAGMRATGRAVVVEGYTDVIRAHEAGFANVVASLGTALTEHHVGLLKRYAATVILALDADAAGHAATLRGLDVAREAAGGEAVPVPTASGLVRYQQRLEIELRVAVLPEGLDPDDVVRDTPDLWRQLIEQSKPVMEYLFDALTADLDLTDPAGKMAAADRLLPVIGDMPDPVARAAWVSRLADRIHLDERALAARVIQADREARARGRRAVGGARDSALFGGAAGGPAREAGALGLAATAPADLSSWLLGHLLVNPPLIRMLAERLRTDGQPALAPGDFMHRTERDLLEAVRNAARGAAPPDAPPEHRLDALPAELVAHVEALKALAQHDPPLPDRAHVDGLRTGVLLLRERECRRRLEELRQLLGSADPEDRDSVGERIRAAGADLAALHRLLRPEAGREYGKVDAALHWG